MPLSKVEIHRVQKRRKINSLRKQLWKKIHRDKKKIVGNWSVEDLCFVAQDKEGNLLGAICGYTVFSYCYVEALEVDENRRRKGIGRKLLKAMEQEAKKRKCRCVNLATANYQAPDFYRKNGYRIYHRLINMPGKHQAFLMDKILR